MIYTYIHSTTPNVRVAPFQATQAKIEEALNKKRLNRRELSELIHYYFLEAAANIAVAEKEAAANIAVAEKEKAVVEKEKAVVERDLQIKIEGLRQV